jgi:trans-2,3-dihydro-3-hydroxyanthranilate isomerase
VAARFFYAKHGNTFSEDPGTGSACANLGGWLFGAGHALPCSFQVSQGEAVDHPCRLLLDVTAERAIQVSGRVIVLGRGSVEI